MIDDILDVMIKVAALVSIVSVALVLPLLVCLLIKIIIGGV